MGGPAEYFAEPHHVDELQALVRRCRAEESRRFACWAADRICWCATKECRAWSFACRPRPSPRSRSPGRRCPAGGGAKLGHVISTVGPRRPGRPGNAGRHSRHHRRRPARQRRQPRRRHRPMDLPGHSHDPHRRNHRRNARRPGVRLSPKQPRRTGDPRAPIPAGGGRSGRADQADAKAVDREEGRPAAGASKRRLHLQESPRHERRHVDRSGRPEGHARRRPK